MVNAINSYINHIEEWTAENTIGNRLVALRQFFGWKNGVLIKYEYIEDENGDEKKVEIEEADIDEGKFKNLEEYGEYLDEIHIQTFHIEDFATYMLNEGYANRSVQNKCYGISDFSNFIAKRGYGDVDVDVSETRVDDLEGNEIDNHVEKRYLEEDELNDLISSARNLRDRVLLRLMADTGMRASEAVSITIDQINRDERSIENVVNAKQLAVSDEEETRTVYFTKRFSLLLDKWLGGERDSYMYTGTDGDEGHLLVTKQQPKMAVGRVNEIFDETAERAGIQEHLYEDMSGRPRRKYSSHVLRHTFSVLRVQNGMPIIWLKELLGHSDLEELKSYLKFKDKDKKDAYNQYSP
ncbi:tyrosine-type recombinase/integrase [Halobacterium salinarum]|uniref:tyrosine-type recombinase/integrase n=1 Tax=Halobacterium salinarum TaxID=2242 RepID=UPI002557B5C0|nr:site-specific integrase [Halobacterium salinarum]MDL0145642.1 site-specific integrase [Halobacterium salinarum]